MLPSQKAPGPAAAAEDKAGGPRELSDPPALDPDGLSPILLREVSIAARRRPARRRQ